MQSISAILGKKNFPISLDIDKCHLDSASLHLGRGHSSNATMQREAYSECFAFFVERGSRRIPAKIKNPGRE